MANTLSYPTSVSTKSSSTRSMPPNPPSLLMEPGSRCLAADRATCVSRPTENSFISSTSSPSRSPLSLGHAQKGTAAETLTTEPALSEQDKEGETFNSSAEILVHPNGKFVYSSKPRSRQCFGLPGQPEERKTQGYSGSTRARSFPEKHQLEPGCDLVACSGCGLQHVVAAHRVDPRPENSLYQRGSIINALPPSASSSPISIKETAGSQFGTTAREPVAHAKITKWFFLSCSAS